MMTNDGEYRNLERVLEETKDELQRERKLHQLDNQERAKLKAARDELAQQVLLLEQKLEAAELAQERHIATISSERSDEGREDVGLAAEVKALQADVDTLLVEVEKERDINKELEKIIKDKDREKNKMNDKLIAVEKKMAKLKEKNRKSGKEDGQGGDLEEVIEALQLRIASLTESRNRLIASLDSSADELDRITKENEALSTTVQELRDTCASWEKQVEESIQMNIHLKELLEEGSEWKAPRGGNAEGASVSLPPSSVADVSTTSAEEMAILKAEYDRTLLHYKSLEANMMQWQGRCAALEIQVAALCAELTRLASTASGYYTSIVPLLCSIESRVEGLTN